MKTSPPPSSTATLRDRTLSSRREALTITALVSVAIIVIIAIALVVSGGNDPSPTTAAGAADATRTATTTGVSASVATSTVTTQPDPTATTETAAVEPTNTEEPDGDSPSVPPLAPPAPTANDGEGDGEAGGPAPTPEPTPTTGDSVPEPGSAAEGFIPDGEGISPFDSEHPALANLDPALLAAVQQAAADAEAEGILMVITSGWRSASYQQRLLDEAILNYGSEEEARKWVLSPDLSSHVSGKAIDIGFTDADYWMIQWGSAYGLCQTYANEIWHFELMVEPGGTCPAPIEDASHR